MAYAFHSSSSLLPSDRRLCSPVNTSARQHFQLGLSPYAKASGRRVSPTVRRRRARIWPSMPVSVTQHRYCFCVVKRFVCCPHQGAGISGVYRSLNGHVTVPRDTDRSPSFVPVATSASHGIHGGKKHPCNITSTRLRFLSRPHATGRTVRSGCTEGDASAARGLLQSLR